MKKEDNHLLYIILAILIVLMLIKMIKEQKEGFQNNNNDNNNNNNNNNNNDNKYTKFNETVLGKEGMNKNIVWKNKSLSQCKFECDEDEKCIGFSREKIKDDEKGNCYHKQKIGDCHSLRRGDPSQRDYAIGFDSYVKQSYNNDNLLTKCIGDKNTLNRKIYINSYIEPNAYISVFNNDIRCIIYEEKNNEFHKNCIFEVVEGLEGTGTISFIIIDNFQENYYLSVNIDTNTLVLVPIDIKKSSVRERSYASFELFDGFSDPSKISIRTFSTVGEHYFWILEGYHTKDLKSVKNPSIRLVRENTINNRIAKEAATFNISHKNIKSKEEFMSEPFIHHNNQELVSHYTKLNKIDNTNDTSSNYQKNTDNTFDKSITKLPKTVKEKYFNKEDFQSKKPTPKYSANTNTVILIDKNGNKLMIPSSIDSINSIDLKNMVSKLNKIYKRDCPPNRFNVRDIENLKINENRIFKTSKEGVSVNDNTDLIKHISDLNIIYRNSRKFGFSNKSKEELHTILNTYTTNKDIQKEIIEKLNNIYTKNCNPRKFNMDEINVVLITNPEKVSCRLYNYDYTISGEFGEDNTIYDYENIINNTNMGLKKFSDYDMGELVYMAQLLGIDTSNKNEEELYNNIIIKAAYKENIELENGRIYLNKPDKTYLNKLLVKIKNKQEFDIDSKEFEKYVRNIIKTNMTDTEQLEAIRKYEIAELFSKINQKKYFKIKSIQIFNHNPKDNFNKKTEDYNKIDYISDKLRNLEKDHVNDTTNETFGKFKKNKELELDAYKNTVYHTEMKLKQKRKKLERDIEELSNASSNYKLDKFSKDSFFMKKQLN